MSNVEIVKPTEGTVTLTMSYEAASALTRLLGIVNGGVARKTGLHDISAPLLSEFGVNDKPKGKYTQTEIRHGQIHIFENGESW